MCSVRKRDKASSFTYLKNCKIYLFQSQIYLSKLQKNICKNCRMYKYADKSCATSEIEIKAHHSLLRRYPALTTKYHFQKISKQEKICRNLHFRIFSTPILFTCFTPCSSAESLKSFLPFKQMSVEMNEGTNDFGTERQFRNKRLRS